MKPEKQLYQWDTNQSLTELTPAAQYVDSRAAERRANFQNHLKNKKTKKKTSYPIDIYPNRVYNKLVS